MMPGTVKLSDFAKMFHEQSVTLQSIFDEQEYAGFMLDHAITGDLLEGPKSEILDFLLKLNGVVKNAKTINADLLKGVLVIVSLLKEHLKEDSEGGGGGENPITTDIGNKTVH